MHPQVTTNMPRKHSMCMLLVLLSLLFYDGLCNQRQVRSTLDRGSSLTLVSTQPDEAPPAAHMHPCLTRNEETEIGSPGSVLRCLHLEGEKRNGGKSAEALSCGVPNEVKTSDESRQLSSPAPIALTHKRRTQSSYINYPPGPLPLSHRLLSTDSPESYFRKITFTQVS